MQFFTVCVPKTLHYLFFLNRADVLVVTGVLVPLLGVLFGYTQIYLKVRKVKSRVRQHRQRVIPTVADVASTGLADLTSAQPGNKIQQSKKAGYTQDDLKLAKTLFTTFVVFLVCW